MMAERPGMTDGAPVPGSGPLAGVVVVDLTRVLAGPYCTMMLSDLGARVIKIERPGTGDDSRHIGPFINGVSAYFASLNRGKESIALDLRDDEDRARFETLLAEADVVMENFRVARSSAWATTGRRFSSLSEADLRRGVGVRSHRPLRDPTCVRHGRAGHGRRDEHHRPGGRPADVGGHFGR